MTQEYSITSSRHVQSPSLVCRYDPASSQRTIAMVALPSTVTALSGSALRALVNIRATYPEGTTIVLSGHRAMAHLCDCSAGSIGEVITRLEQAALVRHWVTDGEHYLFVVPLESTPAPQHANTLPEAPVTTDERGTYERLLVRYERLLSHYERLLGQSSAEEAQPTAHAGDQSGPMPCPAADRTPVRSGVDRSSDPGVATLHSTDQASGRDASGDRGVEANPSNQEHEHEPGHEPAPTPQSDQGADKLPLARLSRTQQTLYTHLVCWRNPQNPHQYIPAAVAYQLVLACPSRTPEEFDLDYGLAVREGQRGRLRDPIAWLVIRWREGKWVGFGPPHPAPGAHAAGRSTRTPGNYTTPAAKPRRAAPQRPTAQEPPPGEPPPQDPEIERVSAHIQANLPAWMAPASDAYHEWVWLCLNGLSFEEGLRKVTQQYCGGAP